MRTLYLLRHAKSGWDDPTLADIDRPITERGRRAAQALGEHLRRSGVRPKLVLCSPALRTRQTLDLVAPGLGVQAKVVVDQGIYAASAGRLWDRIHALPDEADEVLIVGHNPGLHELASGFTDHGDDKLRARVRAKLPTCAFVTVAWGDDSWAQVKRSAAVLHDYLTPRDT